MINISDKEIIQSYLKNKKITLVMKETGVSYVKIKRILMENNLFEQKLHIKRKRKFDVDDNYFSKIDTKEKAYWLGFLWGDGYISPNQNRVGIAIKSSDKEHLEKFKKAIRFKGNIGTYKTVGGYKIGVEYCRIAFKSEKMIEDLKKIGFLEKKSLIMKPPSMSCMTRQLRVHFWRGIIDANGSICPSNKIIRKQFYFHIIGTLEMIADFKELFQIHSSIKLGQRYADCEIYDFRINITKTNQWILEKIYEDSEEIRLNRKYDVYQEYLRKQSTKN